MIHLQLLHQYNYNADLEHQHESKLVVRAFWTQGDTVEALNSLQLIPDICK